MTSPQPTYLLNRKNLQAFLPNSGATQGCPLCSIQSIPKEISPGCSLEGLMWSWHSNTLATWQEELTHLKRPWCWERLRAGGEGDDRGWDGWMASPTQWKWVWVNSSSWWWTGRSGVLWFMGLQRVGHDWATELNNLLLEVLATAIREGKGI